MSELKGKKIAVLVETEYIPGEVEYYRSFFEKQGAEVEFMTYLWGKTERTIVSDVDSEDKQAEKMVVTKEN